MSGATDANDGDCAYAAEGSLDKWRLHQLSTTQVEARESWGLTGF